MPDLFAEVVIELPRSGTRGPWHWVGNDHELDIRLRGELVAVFFGPDRYDYLMRLMAAAPHADA